MMKRKNKKEREKKRERRRDAKRKRALRGDLFILVSLNSDFCKIKIA